MTAIGSVPLLDLLSAKTSRADAVLNFIDFVPHPQSGAQPPHAPPPKCCLERRSAFRHSVGGRRPARSKRLCGSCSPSSMCTLLAAPRVSTPTSEPSRVVQKLLVSFHELVMGKAQSDYPLEAWWSQVPATRLDPAASVGLLLTFRVNRLPRNSAAHSPAPPPGETEST